MSPVTIGPTIEAALTAAQTTLAAVVTPIPVRIGRPIVTDWAAYLETFRRPDGRIEGWLLDVDWTETPYSMHENELTIRLFIDGFRSVDLAANSRTAFRTTVAAVCDAFRTATLGGLVDLVEPIAPRTPPDEGGGMLTERTDGEILCHVANLLLIGRALVVW